MNSAVSRRGFLGGLGAIVATISIGPVAAFAQGVAELTGSLKVNRALDGWIRVDAAGTITLFTGKVELGQGILTALAQIAAEELDVRFDVMRVVSADTTRSPDEGYTYGSQSVEQSGAAIRVAAAQARHRLLMAAASRLDARLEDLTVAAGVVTGLNGRHITYWELVAGKADLLAIQVSADVALKPAKFYKIVGQSVQRIDLLPKLTGGQAFIQDLRLPGMLFGRVVRPRRYRAKLLRIDDSGVRKMPGVVAVVREGSFLAVIARREEQAIAARDALAKAAIWDQSGPALPNDQQLVPALKSWPEEVSVVGEKGQATAAPAGRRIKSTFSRPYLSQGSLAPSCGFPFSVALTLRAFGRAPSRTGTNGVWDTSCHAARVCSRAQGESAAWPCLKPSRPKPARTPLPPSSCCTALAPTATTSSPSPRSSISMRSAPCASSSRTRP
ncbi:MAG: twin-arginine translocation signal domain-containing protein [Comamonadaceae bacterium]|nr:MAG: twin-arginine translocation signal domain-containing protein [Comamonadaceae bacterium]